VQKGLGLELGQPKTQNLFDIFVVIIKELSTSEHTLRAVTLIVTISDTTAAVDTVSTYTPLIANTKLSSRQVTTDARTVLDYLNSTGTTVTEHQ